MDVLGHGFFRSAEDLYGFDDRKLIWKLSPVFAVMFSSIMFGDLLVSDPRLFFLKAFTLILIYVVILWLLFREFHIRSVIHCKDLAVHYRHYQVMIPGLILIYIIFRLVISFTFEPIAHRLFPMDISYEAEMIKEVISYLLFAIMMFSVYDNAVMGTLLKKSLIEKEQLVKENMASQLEGLRNQVNPHFLFNSLNTLAAIIPEDSDQAVRFVQKLSKCYRYILEIRDTQIISLEEELSFLNAYNFLLNERFGNNLRITVDIDKNLYQKMVIPLALQILMENAIKHNVISKAKPLDIEVYSEGDHYLVIKNGLQKKNQVMSSTKMGLENIATRYRFFSSTAIISQETQSHFIVKIPLLNTENSQDV